MRENKWKGWFCAVCIFLGFAHQPAYGLIQYIGGGDPQNAIGNGGIHSLALKTEGSLIAWGSNASGQANAPADSHYMAVAAGTFHSLAVKGDGILAGWGSNNYGQTDVPSGSNYVAVAAGSYHSAALKSDGTLVGWGSNTKGQTTVPAGSNYVAIAAGNYHCLGLTSNGTLVAWGNNQYGQTDIPPGSNYVAVAAGGNHSLALTSEGTLVGWGTNNFGESDVPPGSNYVAIIAGDFQSSLALRSDGTLVGWGRNDSGQIDVPPGSNYVAIANSLALTSDGTLVAWGYDGSGQLDIPLPNTEFGYDSGIVPPSGSVEGGTFVEISGARLGNGSDITNVTLCGVAASIVTQMVDSVTVIAAAGTLGTGDVDVQSVSRGITSRADGFTYKIMMNQTIDFPSIGNRLVTDTVELAAMASSGLGVRFKVISGPASISSGTNLTLSATGMVAIEASQSGNLDWNPAVLVTNTFTVVEVDVLSGPAVGGNTITIHLGSGSVVSVLIGGVPATVISGTGTSAVAVEVPTGLPTGTQDVTVLTSDEGTIVLKAAYVINPVGEIVGRNRPASLDLASLNGTEGFVINGIGAAAYSGCSVGGAGDVNNDGIDDLIIGAYGPGGLAGESYVIFGTMHDFPASFELAGLNGTNGFIIHGIDGSDQSGGSVSGAGDVNGDGVDDLIIGASGAGESYVVYGSVGGFSASIELAALDGTNGFMISGLDASDYTGRSVAGAGDVNGDGLDDLIIGAYGADLGGRSNVGASYVVYGTSSGFPSSLQLSVLNGTNGFAIHGLDATDYSGASVDGVGDVNGDGVDDLIIGASAADPGGRSLAGESYVVYGSSDEFPALLELSALNGTNGFVINGIAASDRSGSSVRGAGDVNGDGLDDLIIGAGSASPSGIPGAGENYVVFGTLGGFPASLELSLLNGTNGFIIHGIDESDRAGSVNSVGDVNDDGLDDLIIGAGSADPSGISGAGESYVVYGSSSGFPALLELATLNDTHGFVINGIDANDGAGSSVSSAGDVNGDGVDDLIIGARYGDPGGRSNAGESYVVFGESVKRAVFPGSGSLYGGYQVIITGNNLGNGSDVTHVTLNGAAVLSIDSQSASRIVVTAAAGPVGVGDVVVYSTSYGTTTKEDAFTYEKLDQAIAFPFIGNRLVTDAVALSASASSSLGVDFTVISGLASISSGSNLTFSATGMVAIEASQSGDTDWHVAVPVTNLFFVADIDVLNGPAAGGNTITIDLGSGSITNVLIGGKVALILSGSATPSVTVQVPSGLTSGTCDINLQTSDLGDVLLSAVYTVNPVGSIRGGDPQNAIAAGASHSLALKKDGTLIGWGFNDDGQAVAPPGSNYVAMAAGGGHSLALQSDGTLIGWGLNDYGQTDVPPGSNYVAVAAGDSHSLALKSDGSLIGWGGNEAGQAVVPLGSNYMAVAAGARHSLALKSDGTLAAWGWSIFGQTDVPPGSDYIAVAAGSVHSLALKSDGTLVGWGNNYYGQSDVPSGSDYMAVAAGSAHSLALRSDGTLIGWGLNDSGQIDVPPGSNYAAIAAGGAHSLALTSDGTLVAWGLNDYGQIDVPVPNTAVGVGYGVNPVSGPFSGGTEVVISGINLGSGSDITNVTLCGIAATIVSQAVDSVTVITGSGTAGTGDVVVRSVRYGATSSADVFTYEKMDQDIDFSEIGNQTVVNTVGLEASASSGLAVQFAVVSGPGVILDGTNMSFSGAGTVLLEVSQGGDVNWHPAQSITNVIDVVGVLTTVMPNVGTGAGGTEVVISGRWLGNGADITRVMLCDVEALIVAQDKHSVTVFSGETNTPVAITGAVVVESGYGPSMLADAYTYYSPLPDAPVAITAVDITSDHFTARWLNTADATHYYLDVSESANFTSYVETYSNWNVGAASAALVAGLADGETYWYRVRAANSHGSSANSSLIEVPVTENTPYVRVEITNGIASAGSSDTLDLADLFHGTNVIYSVVTNTNPTLVTPMIQGSMLILDYADGVTGTAAITVRVTDSSGFSVDTTIIVTVIAEPGVSVGAITFNSQSSMYEQVLTVTNTSATRAAKAVTLTVTSLDAGAELANATGIDLMGNPEIQWNGALAPGASRVFTLQYSTLSANTIPSVKVEVSLSLEDVSELIVGQAFGLLGGAQVLNGDLSFLIEFETVPGKTYYIQYADTLDGEWQMASPTITAHVSSVQWIDAGPPSTERAPGSVTNRFYRVIESSE